MSIDARLPACLQKTAPASVADADVYLMWGLLVDAAEMLVLGAEDPWRDDEVLTAEIRVWVAANDRAWPFSFVNACAALGIEPDELRDELAPWLATPPPASD